MSRLRRHVRETCICILVVATFAFTSELNDRHASLIHGAKITITRTQEIDINGYRVFL